MLYSFIVLSDFCSLWSSVGFSVGLSKGPSTTKSIFYIHSEAHHFSLSSPGSLLHSSPYSTSSSTLFTSRVFSASISHFALVLLWLSGMAFHGSYFSNYSAWVADPIHVIPGAQIVSSIVGQDIINSDLGGCYFSGIHITSGLFSLWLTTGIVSLSQLKFSSMSALFFSLVSVFGGYFHIHVLWSSHYSLLGSYALTQCPSSHPFLPYPTLVLFSLSSLFWSGHCYHVSVSCDLLCSTHLSYLDSTNLWSFRSPCSFDYYYSSTSSLFDSSGSLSLPLIVSHHLFLGLSGILVSMISLFFSRVSSSAAPRISQLFSTSSTPTLSFTSLLLGISLSVVGSLSLLEAHHSYQLNCYKYLSIDYLSMLSLSTHHLWIGGFFIIGGASHVSIFLVSTNPTSLSFLHLLSHRDILLGHLSWVCIFLGCHSFGLYIHNDTNQALSSPADLFSDNSLQLTPIFARVFSASESNLFTLRVLDGHVISHPNELSTPDFLIHHIHAFTIHVCVLILLKGALYSRSSRLVTYKFRLGFRYPCDGPGRGGTCQISPWDHIFLSLFWLYNSLAVAIFHLLWKSSSDFYGDFVSSSSTFSHTSAPDFSVNSITINGWLRNFLWSKIGPLIQGYSTSLSGYTLLFLSTHFVWAFSLMFLFSGRGYWQEFLESILWSHSKLSFSPSIAPRALSINQGRCVGVTHYLLGAIGTNWTFFSTSVKTSLTAAS
jgi:photosystem I P700 chlorophyll a apoprotein A1